MQGFMVLALEDLFEARRGHEAWVGLLEGSELEGAALGIDPRQDYADSKVFHLLEQAADALGLEETDLHFTLGRHMAPGLLEMGRSMGVLQEGWKSLDILENLPRVMEAAQQLVDSQTKPVEVVRTLRLQYNEVAVVYRSPRQLCHLLRGILEGLGEEFEEPVLVKEPVCMRRGGPLCRMAVTLDDPLLARYVDVMREFTLVRERGDRITLFNQYRGVPISSQGEVETFTRDQVTIKAGRAQLVSMQKQGKTWLSLPHLPTGLEASVVTVTPDKGVAILGNLALTGGAVGKRSQTRVQPVKEIPVTMRVGERELEGSLYNISEGGMMVVVDEGEQLDRYLFDLMEVNFTLPFDWVDTEEALVLGPQEVWARGNLLDLEAALEGQRLRLLFTPLGSNEAGLIRQYVRNRQEEVLARKKREEQ